MKNMILQVKNSNESISPKGGLTAKRSNRWLAIGLTVLCTVLLAGCKDKPGALIGGIEKPVWTATTDYDLSSSMTAVVRVDLFGSFTDEELSAAKYAPSANDELAAFAGTTCLGVGTWNETYDAYWLYITAPTDDEELVLRYYSAALKQIFVATTTLPYHNDTQVGTAAAPYTPQWIVTPDRE